jgi:hypothetical protein
MNNKIILIISCFIIANCSDEDSNQARLSAVILPEYSFFTVVADCSLAKGNSLIDLESFLSSQAISKGNIDTSVSVLFPDNSASVNTFLIYIKGRSEVEAINRINNIYIDGLESISTCSYAQPSKSLTLFTNPLSLSQSEDYSITEILNCSYNDGYSYGSFVIAVDRLIQKMEMFKSKYEIDYIELRDESSFLWVNRFNNSFYESELPDLWLKNPEESTEIQNEFKDNAVCNNATVYKEFSL